MSRRAVGAAPVDANRARTRSRTALSILLACAMLLAVAGPALAAASVSRIFGSDRYETSAEIAVRAYSGGTPNVVIATGENWPDALAGGPLAHKVAAPILLTRRDELPAPIHTAIGTLGATRAYILGGYAVIDPAVELDLIAAGINPANITRIAGADRYETAELIAQFIHNYDMTPHPIAYFATGDNFPDALAAGPFAASFERPILLVKRDEIPASTLDAISGLSVTTSYVLGGTGVVSDAVLSALPGATRLGGADRYETAAIIAEHGLSQGGQDHSLYTATGESFPDALSAAPLAAGGPFPIIPVRRDSVPAPSEAYITTHEPSIMSWYMIGGEGAVSSACEQAIHDLVNP